MPGLVPGIHAVERGGRTWMAGTSPAMAVSVISQRRPHRRSRLDVTPPIHPVGGSAVFVALGLHLFEQVRERRLIERRFRLAHRPAEVDDPHVSRAAGQVEAVDPRREDIAVRPAIRIERVNEPRARNLTLDVERAALGVAHEGDAEILELRRSGYEV
jgi:hypothetical protein